MIAKANIDRLDFGLKKITNNHSHIVFTNEDKYQNYKPDPDSKTKIIYKSNRPIGCQNADSAKII